MRALASTVYPAGLEAHGLGGDVARYPLEVEEAVYFSCRALGGDARIWADGDSVRFEVRGAFAEAAVEHARARTEAVGGQLTVSADAVVGSVPASPSAR